MRISMNRSEDRERNMDLKLMEVCHLDLSVEGNEIFSDTGFSLQKHRGYLIVGPDEDANVLLLKTIGGLVPPRSHHKNRQGQVFFQGIDMYEGSEQEIKEVKKKIAFVFREGTMISNLTVRENLLLPFLFHCPSEECSTALEKLEKDFKYFGIPDVYDKRPDLISYCLKKKLAFIRASLQRPELILIEKPMFNLEEEDRDQVIEYFVRLKKEGITFIIVSRSQAILETLIDEAIVLEEGKTPTFIGKSHKEFTGLSRFTSKRSLK